MPRVQAPLARVRRRPQVCPPLSRQFPPATHNLLRVHNLLGDNLRVHNQVGDNLLRVNLLVRGQHSSHLRGVRRRRGCGPRRQ